MSQWAHGINRELANAVRGASGNVRVRADLHPGGILDPCPSAMVSLSISPDDASREHPLLWAVLLSLALTAHMTLCLDTHGLIWALSVGC